MLEGDSESHTVGDLEVVLLAWQKRRFTGAEGKRERGVPVYRKKISIPLFMTKKTSCFLVLIYLSAMSDFGTVEKAFIFI